MLVLEFFCGICLFMNAYLVAVKAKCPHWELQYENWYRFVLVCSNTKKTINRKSDNFRLRLIWKDCIYELACIFRAWFYGFFLALPYAKVATFFAVASNRFNSSPVSFQIAVLLPKEKPPVSGCTSLV